MSLADVFIHSSTLALASPNSAVRSSIVFWLFESERVGNVCMVRQYRAASSSVNTHGHGGGWLFLLAVVGLSRPPGAALLEYYSMSSCASQHEVCDGGTKHLAG